MALEMATECEKCGVALPEDGDATICSYECTWCRSCAESFEHVCPTCGGALQTRPARATST